MPEYSVKVSRIFNELRKADSLNKSIVVNQGGSSSSKTWSTLQFLVYKCLETPATTVRVGRQDAATCRLSCFADLQNMLIEQFGLFDPSCLNKTTMTYTFTNGSTINFVGLSDAAKARGARVDYSFINECTEVSKAVYEQVSVRTKKMTILDFNPVTQTGYYYDLKSDPSCHYIISTWRDNIMIPEKNKQKILSWEPTPQNTQNGTADKYLWDVYSLGKPARRENVIFPLWAECSEELWPSPNACHFKAYGLDFGYSNDPTGIVEVSLHDNKLYLKELLYERELITQSNPDYPDIPSIHSRLQEMGMSTEAQIIADCANPSDIQALKLCGYRIQPVEKGADSILRGLMLMKEYPLVIHENSMNLKSELNQYSWKTTTNGAVTAIPEDRFNHLIDGIRYVTLTKLKPRVSEQYRDKRVARRRSQVGGVVQAY